MIHFLNNSLYFRRLLIQTWSGWGVLLQTIGNHCIVIHWSTILSQTMAKEVAWSELNRNLNLSVKILQTAMLKPFQLDMPISGTSKQFEELINKFFAFQFSFKIKIHLQRKIDSHFRIDSCLSFSSKSQHEMPFLNFAHFFCLHLWYQATISEALYETHIKKKILQLVRILALKHLKWVLLWIFLQFLGRKRFS